MISPRWQHRLCLTSPHKNNNASWMTYQWENPRIWTWGWSIPLQRQKTASERYSSHYMLATLSFPRPAQHLAKRSLLSLWFLQWEKRAQNGLSAWSVNFWEHLLWSYPLRITGQSVWLDHWQPNCERKGGRCLQQPALASQKNFLPTAPK